MTWQSPISETRTDEPDKLDITPNWDGMGAGSAS